MCNGMLQAERRIGQLMNAQAKAVGKAKGNRHTKLDGFSQNPARAPTLAEAGIDKSLAHRARTLAQRRVTTPGRATPEGGMASDDTRPVSLDELDGLRVNKAGQLYWRNAKVRTEVKLPNWAVIAAWVAAVATAVQAAGVVTDHLSAWQRIVGL
jgi:hypothetical protein